MYKMKKYWNKIKKRNKNNQVESSIVRLDKNSYEDKLNKLDNRKKHLVVDDSETNRDVLEYYLNQKNIETDIATNGAEAVDKVMALGLDYYSVIWMDINMPFLDGIKATQLLLERGYKNLIIVLTGYITKSTLLQCKLKGADKILTKPVIERELYKMSIFDKY